MGCEDECGIRVFLTILKGGLQTVLFMNQAKINPYLMSI